MTQVTWGAHVDYIVTVLGWSVGVGTFWRFPFLCLRNGGGAYLIPYILFSFLGGLPCLLLEMTTGQYSKGSAIKLWNLCPPFKGLGVSMVLLSLSYSTYYPSQFSWFLYYLYHTFDSSLPWVTCSNPWNTPRCVSGGHITTQHDNSSQAGGCVVQHNSSHEEGSNMTCVTAGEEFWKLKVLELTDGLEDLGGVRWPLVLCLAGTYLVVFLCLFKGIRITGKVVYVTVLLPYVLITVFLVRGCLLPGSIDGIRFYINPDFTKLLLPRVWVEAGANALFSLGISYGMFQTLAGHNKFRNNCLRDAFIITIFDVASGIYFGFAFFAVIGHVAYLQGVSVDSFQTAGINLGFIVYPEAISALPFPQVWTALTFVMLILLGFDSLMPCYEVVVAAIVEIKPKFQKRQWAAYVAVLVPSFLCCNVFILKGGLYVFTLVDWFCSFPSCAIIALGETIVITWIYGVYRLKEDAKKMWNQAIPLSMIIMMKYVCPICIAVILGYSLYTYRPPKYGGYIYPAWANVIGWSISVVQLTPVPVFFVLKVYKTHGATFKEKLMTSLKPDPQWLQDQEMTHERNPLSTSGEDKPTGNIGRSLCRPRCLSPDNEGKSIAKFNSRDNTLDVEAHQQQCSAI